MLPVLREYLWGFRGASAHVHCHPSLSAWRKDFKHRHTLRHEGCHLSQILARRTGQLYTPVAFKALLGHMAPLCKLGNAAPHRGCHLERPLAGLSRFAPSSLSRNNLHKHVQWPFFLLGLHWPPSSWSLRYSQFPLFLLNLR